MPTPKPGPQSDRPDIDVMSMLSHQLSTPLAAVRWYAEILRKGTLTTPLNDTQLQFVDEILNGAIRMGELVEDVHNVSRLDRDKYTDDPVPTDLAKLLAGDIEPLQASLTAHRQQVSFKLPPQLPALIARPSVLQMVTQNLLSNAAKYTPDAGTITVTARPATPADVPGPGARLAPGSRAAVPGPAAYLSVTDTGYGIPTAQQDRLYEQFFRADNVRALGIPGSGLGLYIVARATAKLGGAAWITSTENHGTTACVVLPQAHKS
ncbi:MAG TPA: HAMP domain-containing sensor histidine kinase [Candidatus Saccharimonadia bacterium]